MGKMKPYMTWQEKKFQEITVKAGEAGSQIIPRDLTRPQIVCMFTSQSEGALLEYKARSVGMALDMNLKIPRKKTTLHTSNSV